MNAYRGTVAAVIVLLVAKSAASQTTKPTLANRPAGKVSLRLRAGAPAYVKKWFMAQPKLKADERLDLRKKLKSLNDRLVEPPNPAPGSFYSRPSPQEIKQIRATMVHIHDHLEEIDRPDYLAFGGISSMRRGEIGFLKPPFGLKLSTIVGPTSAIMLFYNAHEVLAGEFRGAAVDPRFNAGGEETPEDMQRTLRDAIEAKGTPVWIDGIGTKAMRTEDTETEIPLPLVCDGSKQYRDSAGVVRSVPHLAVFRYANFVQVVNNSGDVVGKPVIAKGRF